MSLIKSAPALEIELTRSNFLCLFNAMRHYIMLVAMVFQTRSVCQGRTEWYGYGQSVSQLESDAEVFPSMLGLFWTSAYIRSWLMILVSELHG